MKAVILAGGMGTRISEESHLKPKPMIEIGGTPILWHIMKHYSTYGINEFIICLGYKGHMIKSFFADYFLHTSDVTFDLSAGNKMTVHSITAEPWKVTLVDTGLCTMTGGRIKRIKKYIDDDFFLLTYGDGVSDVDIAKLLDFHAKHGKLATLTAVSSAQRFGVMETHNDEITAFREKSTVDGSWINGGFMVLNKKVIDYISGDETIFEKEPLETLSTQKQLMAYKHYGFWECMDTQRDKIKLEELWNTGKAPWKTWK